MSAAVDLAVLLISLLPSDTPCIDHVDRVEVNHLYNGDGALVLDQVIWWDWNVEKARWDVVEWRLLKDVRRVNEDAQKQWDRDNPEGPPYVAEWIGGHATPVLADKYS